MAALELRTIQPEERSAVLDLLAHWFGEPSAEMRAFFARYFEYDPTFRDDLCFVATDAGRIVSTLQVFGKAVRLNDTVVQVGGIGNVFTLPAYRETGVASQLLKMAVAAMEAHAFDLSLLFATRLPFYTRLGWQSHVRHLVFIEGSAAPTPRTAAIEPFASADLDAVREIYEAYNAALSGSTLRDEAYWRGQLRYAGNPQEDFRVARRAGRVVAYARATSLYGFHVIMEYAHLPGQEDAAADVLCALHAVADPTLPGSIAQLAIAPLLQERMRSRGLRLQTIEDVFWMWRILSPARLAKALAVDPATLDDENVFFRLFPPDRSVYWIADRF